jgi:integrase
LNARYKWESEQLHDCVLFMVNTGLRPDEAGLLQFRDVTVVKDDAMSEKILEIEVRGKRGVGYCKSMPGAMRPFERLKSRPRPLRLDEPERGGERARPPAIPSAQTRPTRPTDLIFPRSHREMLNIILDQEGMKIDREGQPRTAYSLRHTYICLRSMEGADIYQIAKNCRTRVEMIEKYYASHIKTNLDAAAINVMKPKPKKSSERETPEHE